MIDDRAPDLVVSLARRLRRDEIPAETVQTVTKWLAIAASAAGEALGLLAWAVKALVEIYCATLEDYSIGIRMRRTATGYANGIEAARKVTS